MNVTLSYLVFHISSPLLNVKNQMQFATLPPRTLYPSRETFLFLGNGSAHLHNFEQQCASFTPLFCKWWQQEVPRTPPDKSGMPSSAEEKCKVESKKEVVKSDAIKESQNSSLGRIDLLCLKINVRDTEPHTEFFSNQNAWHY